MYPYLPFRFRPQAPRTGDVSGRTVGPSSGTLNGAFGTPDRVLSEHHGRSIMVLAKVPLRYPELALETPPVLADRDPELSGRPPGHEPDYRGKCRIGELSIRELPSSTSTPAASGRSRRGFLSCTSSMTSRAERSTPEKSTLGARPRRP